MPRTAGLKLIFLIALLTFAIPAFAAEESTPTLVPPSRRVAQQEAIHQPIAVPGNTSWARDVTIAIMWLFIAALLLGPIVVFFETKAPLETPR